MKQETVTEFGEVEYETVECSSCKNMVPKQSAKRFVVGDVKNLHHWGALGKRQYDFDTKTVQEGWACKYCRNDGVVDFPLTSVTNDHFMKFVAMATAVAFFTGLLFGGLF